VLDPRAVIDRLDAMEKSFSLAGPIPSSPPKDKRGWEMKTPGDSPSAKINKTHGPQRETHLEPSVTAVLDHPPQDNPSIPLSEDRVQSAWPGFIKDIEKEKQFLAAAMEEAQVSLNNRGLILSFNKTFNYQLIQKSLDILSPLLIRHFGKSVQLETRLDPQKSSPPKIPSYKEPSPKLSEYEEVDPQKLGPDVQKVLKHFPGTLKRLKS